MAVTGWIKIHRELGKHWLAQDMEKLGRWIDLLLLANYEDGKVLVGDSLVTLKRGQMLMSFSFLSKRWNCSKSTASKFIELLESDGMVERYTERKATILTICKYDSYQQSVDSSPNDIANDCRTIAERLPNEEKKNKEEKEIYNTNSAYTYTREGNIPWVADTERGYASTFIGQGSAIPFSKRVGKTPQEVVKLLEVYLADRELKNKGHKDINEFVNLFLWHVTNKKIALPVEEQKPKERKVISGKEIFEVYG
jgi:predicted transcriptional regulator